VLVKSSRLTGAEADELLDLYQRISTDLSVLRSESPDPGLIRYLSGLLTQARVLTSGRRSMSWRAPVHFLTEAFPAALYRLRWWWVSVAVLNVLFAVAVGWWASTHPDVYAQSMTSEQIKAYVETDFANYYSEFPHHEFAALVWVNNAWVSAQAIAYGILGLPVLYVLATNVVNLGVAGALMITHGRGALFFGLILPHGLLELTAVFVAGATGLRLFWSWIEPGAKTRLQSLAAEGRRAIGMALGLAVVLFVSGLIEGFVTPSGLPTWARITIGIIAESLFIAYVWVVGGRAFRAGETGDLDASYLPDELPVAA
jgi:uncharacterized membrane protein SpoIIM required for sporulation